MIRAVVLGLLLTASLRTAHADSDDEGEISLLLETDEEAWRRPGFRVVLAMPYGEIIGLRGAPSASALGPVLRGGLRLDEDWSLMASFQYLFARPGTLEKLGGVRFAGTIDPTWHVTPYISIAVGFGFGGIVETGRLRMDPSPPANEIETPYTFPNARTPINNCDGVGVATLLRGEWSYVVSTRASATVAVEGFGQWTGCVEETGRVEPDSGEAIVRRQWWPHVGFTLAVGMTFR